MTKRIPLQPLRISVYLDPDARPPVRVEPETFTVDGPMEIIWERAEGSPVQDFYFLRESLHFIHGPGFIAGKTRDHDARYGIFDTCAYSGEFAYTLMVEYRDRYYATGALSVDRFGRGAPAIRNK